MVQDLMGHDGKGSWNSENTWNTTERRSVEREGRTSRAMAWTSNTKQRYGQVR